MYIDGLIICKVYYKNTWDVFIYGNKDSNESGRKIFTLIASGKPLGFNIAFWTIPPLPLPKISLYYTNHYV